MEELQTKRFFTREEPKDQFWSDFVFTVSFQFIVNLRKKRKLRLIHRFIKIDLASYFNSIISFGELMLRNRYFDEVSPLTDAPSSFTTCRPAFRRALCCLWPFKGWGLVTQIILLAKWTRKALNLAAAATIAAQCQRMFTIWHWEHVFKVLLRALIWWF